MAALDSIRDGASSAVRLGRGLADRAIRVAAPPISRAVSRLVSRIPTRRSPRAPVHGTTSFTPARTAAEPEAPAEAEPDQPVTPATVARNIGPPRPVAKIPDIPRPVKKSVPGAKLPPPRPRTS